jgi:hypothetical protein
MDVAEEPPLAGLLITGTVGAGKTTVAAAVGDLLADARVPHAVIDLDELRRRWPAPADDPFDGELCLRNLAAVAANYRAAGAGRLVLAGVVESRHERDRHQKAIGGTLTVCRLRADLPTVHRRLRARHHDDQGGRRWHVHRAGELDGILDAASVEDFAVTTTELSTTEVAAEVVRRAGW